MKKLTFLIPVAVILLLTACSENKPTGNAFGASFDTTGAVTMTDLTAQMTGKTSMSCTVKGTVAEVCQSEGCWFTITNEAGEPVTIKMKEHSFTVPKDIAGKTAYFHGTALLDTTSVETLRDYAKDAGKSKSEIAAIQEPKVEVMVEAEGVILR